MNFVPTYNYIIATVLLLIYLALPATSFAHVGILEKATPGVQTLAASASYDNCPCPPDGQGSDCCDTTFCCCACHAPLSQGLSFTYSPMIATQNFREPSWSLPQVYHPIFVPPQNLA